MATIPAVIRSVVESLLDQVSNGDCIDTFTVVEYGGFRWKCTIKRTQENEISILIRRQKRT
jgi:hypothetical protein